MLNYSMDEITIHSSGQWHLYKGRRFYDSTFISVLSFHSPGLAAVIDANGAYHINLSGKPAYAARYIESWGYYNNIAAVKSCDGWSHIDTSGTQVYKERYAWCGNFQENKSVVRDFESNYFHINNQGLALYKERYAYAGDFKDGIAVVVCPTSGKHTHIFENGAPINKNSYRGLDIYHKGFARARDGQGWGHVNKQGEFLYSQRYKAVEPFYNGQAYVEDFSGNLEVIDEKGKVVVSCCSLPSQDDQFELSTDMVGFWKTHTIAAGVQLGIFNYLPASSQEIANKISLKPELVQRLLRGLWEIGIVNLSNSGIWHISDKGKTLNPEDSLYMSAAAEMWVDVNKLWFRLTETLKREQIVHHPSFKELNLDSFKQKTYALAMCGYAKKDLASIIECKFWQSHKRVAIIGRSIDWFAEELRRKYPDLKVIFSEQGQLNDDKLVMEFDLDGIFAFKYFHSFPDPEVTKRLEIIRGVISKNGFLYIGEMLTKIDSPEGSLLDLNMLLESGGQLRTLEHWRDLFSRSGMEIEQIFHFSDSFDVLKVKYV